MSLMKSLARVAAGVMLAKGLGTMMQNQQQSRGGQIGRRRTGGGILGDLLNTGLGGALGDTGVRREAASVPPNRRPATR